ncbi:MAG: hypothetical protein IPP97_23495 [Candidatus Obscuribacter sp.]|nr:hypothetical protein [Candidatus Obscuribacter sp.]
MLLKFLSRKLLSKPGDLPSGGVIEPSESVESGGSKVNSNYIEESKFLKELGPKSGPNSGNATPSETSQPGESKASTTTESDQTTPATSGSTVGDKGFQPIGAAAKQFLEGKTPTDLPKPNDAPKSPEATQQANPQALLSSQGIVATATDQLKPPESQRTGLPAAPTVTEQAPAKPTQDVAAQDKAPDVSSIQSKAAPQGDAAASIPLVSGAAASTLVTALNRDSPPPDQGKVASVADAAKGALAAPEAKSPAVVEQPKSANLAGESARPVDASSASRAVSTDAHGGYKSDFGSRTPVDTKASAGRLPHGLEGKGSIDKVAEARAPLAGTGSRCVILDMVA